MLRPGTGRGPVFESTVNPDQGGFNPRDPQINLQTFRRPEIVIELSSGRAYASSCQSTNFIVRSAARIVKSWCVRSNGKGLPVRIVALRNWGKSSPFLPRRLTAELNHLAPEPP